MRHHDEDELLEIEIEERGGWGTFVLGALVGAGAALLLAPRSGRETQREIMRALREHGEGPVDGVREALAGWAGQARGGVGGRLDGVRGAVDERVERVRGAVDERVERVRGAVEEGRVAARQARVELRRRVDEAKSTYRSGRAGTPPVPLASAPSAAASNGGEAKAPEVVITAVTTERDAGDLAG
jgi:gas vesicle protein